MLKLNKYIGIACIALGSVVFSAQAKEAKLLKLDDCYKLALQRSEAIASDAQEIKVAEAHFLEAFGTILPHVALSHVENRQQWATSSVSKKGYEEGFVFSQAIFSGFKEFAAISSGRMEQSQREKEKLRAEQLLFVNVSDAFYLLLELRHNLTILQTTKWALSDRIRELDARVDIGKSRQSEVASTNVQLYNTLDAIENARNQELVARELLEFLIGQPVGTLVDERAELTLKAQGEYLAQAATRLDVQAADLAWQQSKKAVTIAQSGFLPSVSLQAEYTNHSTDTPASEHKWSGALVVNVPIFEGTTVLGQVKEAMARERQGRLALELAQRLASQDIRDTYVNMRIDIVRRNILHKALKAAEENYKLEIEDYKRNIVNNLDVLTAIQDLGNARSNYIHMVYEAQRFYRQLLLAAGEIEVKE